MKKLTLCLLLGAMMIVSTTVFAADPVKLIINGVDVTESLDVQPQIVDGKILAPVDAVAEALGAKAEYDEETNTIIISSTTAQVASKEYASRRNAVPVGETVVADFMDAWSSAYKVEITVTEIIRGEEAWDLIIKANQFNDAPGDGQEYILIRLSIKALASKNDEKISINQSSFKAVSANGVTYDTRNAVNPKPGLTAIYQDAETEGYINFLIDVDDTPLIVFRESTNNGIWFSTDFQ